LRAIDPRGEFGKDFTMSATNTSAADATALAPGSLEFYAHAQPDKVAIVDKTMSLTWRQWNDQADRLAAVLAARGIKPGDRVAVRMRTRAEWFVAYHAISKLGASQIGLNWRLTAPESEYILSDSQTRALIFDDEDGDALYDAWKKVGIETVIPLAPLKRPGVATLYDLIEGASNAPAVVAKTRAPLILYTSGTTGKPKGAFPDPSLLMSRIKEVMEYRADVEAAIPVHPGARCLATLPMHHGAGPGSTFPSLALGGVAFLMDRFEPEEALSLIQRERITHWTAVPTMLHRVRALPEEILSRYDVSSIRALTLGASAVPHALKRWAISYFGSHCLYEGYGSSET
jgi:long-chain acyl-CoA synthetase